MFGDDNLFREIGHTLKEIGQEVIQSGTETLRQAVSRRVAESQFGQAVIADVKQTEITRMLPWILIIFVGLFVAGRMLR